MTRISSGYYSANGSLKAAPLLSKHFRKSEAQTQDKFSFSESQTAWHWQGPPELIWSNIPSEARPAKAQDYVQMDLEYLQGGRLPW